MMTQNDLTNFTPHPRYRLLFMGALILIVLFTWSLISSFGFGTLFFLIVCIGFGLGAEYNTYIKISLTAQSIILEPPLRSPKEVEFRQLIQVSEGGRFGKSITILYHPIQEDGLLNLDDAASLFLPTVREQATLLTTLRNRIPA